MPLPSCSGSSEFSLKIVHDLFFFCCAYLFSSLSRVPLFLATKVRIVCTFSEFFFFINRLLFAERNLHILPLHVPGSALVSTALPSARATCPGGSSQGPAAPVAGVWALSWCSLTERKVVSENLFIGVTGMLSGSGSVSKCTYECC